MNKLTREELKTVMGGLLDPPPGYYCFTPPDQGSDPGLPGGGVDPDCAYYGDWSLYCPPGQVLTAC